ncbi:MAG TPA: putative lipid II flippase FtsW [Actinomycetota bacterium]|nr:putative lipid II flippase FtsW [Actinomycetota bacterium]
MATRSGTIGVAGRSARSKTRNRAAVRAVSWSEPAGLLMTTTGVLVLVGLVMILSASLWNSEASPFLYFNKQVMWSVIGLAAFFFFSRFDYKLLKGIGYTLLPVVILLLLVVLIPGIGTNVGGSSRWFRLGPLSFQPSEAAKLALVLFAADVFSRKKEAKFKDFAHAALPMIPILGLLAALVMLQPDLGTTSLLGLIGFGMLFVAGARLRHLLPFALGGGGLALGAALFEPYRRARILAFLNPWADPLNTGYHTIQSLIALGSGGWFGVGLGASRQKWTYVPNAHTDFIFAILGEEMGLLGTLVIVGLFAFLAYLGITTARRAPDRFGMLVAAGITIWITAQALVNMGAVTAALPVTGVPLPLVSFGGTSLVICLAAMGILTNIARQGRRA